MQANPTETIRVHIWIKGRVQGVGYRAHVEYNALRIGVPGWVRNIDRNMVETVAEGTREQIDQFIEIVKQGPSISRVDDVRLEYEEPTGYLEGFTVKRSM
ncbi:MAG: acylphosphatase [Anaerolineales bacterium]|jgi:acylphosphatase|nr:acylphosphatase [Anaerolineales bacterium]